MKKQLVIILSLVIMSILTFGGLACGKSDDNGTEVPKQASVEVSNDEFQTASASSGGVVNKTITVAPSGTLVVTLWSNATTGYSWSEAATISGSGILQQTSHEYLDPQTGLMGAPGKEVWNFKALKKGTCEVSMSYSQPWEGGQKDAYGFLLTVTVE